MPRIRNTINERKGVTKIKVNPGAKPVNFQLIAINSLPIKRGIDLGPVNKKAVGQDNFFVEIHPRTEQLSVQRRGGDFVSIK
jgi:hypothetical protein